MRELTEPVLRYSDFQFVIEIYIIEYETIVVEPDYNRAEEHHVYFSFL